MVPDLLKEKMMHVWESRVLYVVVILILFCGGLSVIQCITSGYNETKMSITIPLYKDVQMFQSTTGSHSVSAAAKGGG